MAVSFQDLHEGTRVQIKAEDGAVYEYTVRSATRHILDVTFNTGVHATMLFAYFGGWADPKSAEVRQTFMKNTGAHIEPNMIAAIMTADGNAFFRVQDAWIM